MLPFRFSALPLSFSGQMLAAGFPSPADDYIEEPLDLADILVRNKQASFLVRASGHSMHGKGLYDGDYLIIDRSVTPRPGHIVVAVVDGEFTLKQLAKAPTGFVLRAAHPDYPDIPANDVEIWGCLYSSSRLWLPR